jgi:hypothetical protein
MLDSKLTFNVQIDYIASKAMKCLEFFKRFGKEFKDPYVHNNNNNNPWKSQRI